MVCDRNTGTWLDSVLLTIGYALTALRSQTVLFTLLLAQTRSFLLGRLCCLFSVPFAKGSSAGPLFDLHHDWMVVSPASFVHACIHSSNISGYLLCGVCFMRVLVPSEIPTFYHDVHVDNVDAHPSQRCFIQASSHLCHWRDVQWWELSFTKLVPWPHYWACSYPMYKFTSSLDPVCLHIARPIFLSSLPEWLIFL